VDQLLNAILSKEGQSATQFNTLFYQGGGLLIQNNEISSTCGALRGGGRLTLWAGKAAANG